MSHARSSAIRKAEDRFEAVAKRFASVYGMRLPRHVTYTAAFFLGLGDEDRRAAERLEANGLFGVGEWFEDGKLDRAPRADERIHGRFRRDPPELVTLVSGGSDGSHWGLWYDDPSELPRVCAHNWARDSAETASHASTLLASIVARHERNAPNGVPRGIADWLAELVALETRAHTDEAIGAPHPRSSWCVGGMGPWGVELPADWTSHAAADERAAAYRGKDPNVLEWITLAKRELAGGEPGRALLLGRELHWLDADEHRAACTELLVGAYRALGRDALAGVVEAHHAARDVPSVDAYAASSSPFFLAVQAGDVAGVTRGLEDPRIDADVIAMAAGRASSPEVQELLFARSSSAVETTLGAALYRASPVRNVDQHAAAAELAASVARGEGREALLARMIHEKRYTVWRAIADHGDALDVEIWTREADRLVARALELGMDPSRVVLYLVDARLFERALSAIDRVDPRWAATDGTTLLHAAANAGAVEVIRALLSRGADPDAIDMRGQTPRDRGKALWQLEPGVGSRVLELLPARKVEAPPPPRAPFLVGDRVAHTKFGEGKVTAVAADAKLTIEFADASRVLLPKFVQRIDG